MEKSCLPGLSSQITRISKITTVRGSSFAKEKKEMNKHLKQAMTVARTRRVR
jgi:hypothetical protein